MLCISFVGCGENKGITKKMANSPLQLLYETKDEYGNILQQVFYNEKTCETLLKEFIYDYKNGSWVCIDQRATVLSNKDNTRCNSHMINSALNIYYNDDLADGPITIMDNEYAKISIVKYLAKDNWWEFGYELKIINKTNQVITVMIDSLSIMDINCKPLFTIDHIDAKNTAYFILAWDKETLERCYIPYIDNIEFMVRIFDNDDWKTPALAGEKILIKK